MLSELFTHLYSTDLEMGILDILLRLVCALVIGIVIGTEREFTNRPAGLRTHMLVALGASVVMIIGQLIFLQYRQFGATPDPARMAAQVITGVGFLGAGTILREGTNVKGLTTAASLWATACLGLAAGAGYYLVALSGMVFIFATLTIFEVIQNKVFHTSHDQETFHVTTSAITRCLETINQAAADTNATVSRIQAQQNSDNQFTVTFHAVFSGSKTAAKKHNFFEKLAVADGIISVATDGEFTAKV